MCWLVKIWVAVHLFAEHWASWTKCHVGLPCMFSSHIKVSYADYVLRILYKVPSFLSCLSIPIFSLLWKILCDRISFDAGMSPTVLDNNSSITSLTVLDNNSLISTSYISVTRFGLGLIPAICSLVSVAVTFTMKLHTPYSKPLVEPLLQWCPKQANTP